MASHHLTLSPMTCSAVCPAPAPAHSSRTHRTHIDRHVVSSLRQMLAQTFVTILHILPSAVHRRPTPPPSKFLFGTNTRLPKKQVTPSSLSRLHTPPVRPAVPHIPPPNTADEYIPRSRSCHSRPPTSHREKKESKKKIHLKNSPYPIYIYKHSKQSSRKGKGRKR